MGKRKNKGKASGDAEEGKSEPQQQQRGQQQQQSTEQQSGSQQQQRPREQQEQSGLQQQAHGQQTGQQQPPRQQQSGQQRPQQQPRQQRSWQQQQWEPREQQQSGQQRPQQPRQQRSWQQQQWEPRDEQQSGQQRPQQQPRQQRSWQQQQWEPRDQYSQSYSQQQWSQRPPRQTAYQQQGFGRGIKMRDHQTYPPPGGWPQQKQSNFQPTPQPPQQESHGWGRRQATPEVTTGQSTPQLRETSLSPVIQRQEEQSAQGGQKKQSQKQQQGQGDVAESSGTIQPATIPQQAVQGATPKQKLSETSGMKLISITGSDGEDVPLIQAQEKTLMRKGGTKCKETIMVLTNHFPLSLGKLTKALHYDVTIEPERPKRLFRAVMEAFRKTFYGNRYPAYDGMKNLYSAYPLCPNEISGKVTVPDDDRDREFEVTIKQVAYVDFSCLNDDFKQVQRESLKKLREELHCIDIILRSAPSLSFIPAGRSFFRFPEGRPCKLEDGAELLKGTFQSTVLGWKPFLNVDTANKAFPMEMMVVDYIMEITRNKPFPNHPLPPYVAEMLEKHLRQLKVQYELPRVAGTKRVYRVNGLGDPPNRARFTDDKGQTTTVENYFKTKKGTPLKYPNWPTLWVGSIQRENKILLPLEFCMILRGQVVNKKMTEKQTRNMIKQTATSARDRLENIKDSMMKAAYNQSPAVAEFGITVSQQPQEVKARVLQPPVLEYAQGAQASVFRGVWKGGEFKLGVSIRTWTIICLDGTVSMDDLEYLEKSLIKSGKSCGVNIPKATRYTGRDFFHLHNYQDLKRQLINNFQSMNYDLIMVVVPDIPKYIYAYVKQAAELAVGRLTQCIRSSTVSRLKPATTNNILLKINTKLTGVNHILSSNSQPSCFKERVVIMGADVTHPSPDSRNIPSVAAVTCSYDDHGFKYIYSWRLQKPKLEIIQDLETIVVEQLLYFREKKQYEPHHIIFFRDGVSDSQFDEVRSSEIRAIRNACTKLSPNYKPQISFFVVQKRHHTRLFPVDDRDSEDRNGNVPAGTCVDTIITHPSDYDFYLVSHASIQGVARPTKYVPLWDDADMSEDDIQHLTYYLCHLFARCNRSVSYPAPTYYAHLAAARAKVYVETEIIDMSRLEETQSRLQVENSIFRDFPMYFV